MSQDAHSGDDDQDFAPGLIADGGAVALVFNRYGRSWLGRKPRQLRVSAT